MQRYHFQSVKTKSSPETFPINKVTTLKKNKVNNNNLQEEILSIAFCLLSLQHKTNLRTR